MHADFKVLIFRNATAQLAYGFIHMIANQDAIVPKCLYHVHAYSEAAAH